MAEQNAPLVEIENVEVEEPKPWQRVVSVTVPVGEWTSARSQAARRTAREVTLPGFRKGKAPKDLVEANLGARIDMDALEWLLPRAWAETLGRIEFHPINDPDWSDIDFGADKPFSFKATVEVRPEVKVDGYRGMKVTWYKEALPEDAGERTLESLREGRGHYHEVDRPAADGDRVTVDFHQVDEGGLPIVGSSVNDHAFELGSPMILTEFSDGVRGLAVGGEKTFDVVYPEDYEPQEMAGQKRRFHATVKRIEERHLPELNDDFAKALGDFENLQALKDRIDNNLRVENEGRNQERLDAALVQAALAKNEFEVPPSMVDSYIDSLFADRDRQSENPMTEQEKEEARGNLKPGAEFAIRRWFLIDAVGKQEGITVSDEEYREHLGKLAEAEGAEVSEIEKSIQRSQAEERLREDLRHRKVLDFLREKAKITEEDIPQEPEGA